MRNSKYFVTISVKFIYALMGMAGDAQLWVPAAINHVYDSHR